MNPQETSSLLAVASQFWIVAFHLDIRHPQGRSVASVTLSIMPESMRLAVPAADYTGLFIGPRATGT
jgi:hypothetical protein